MDAIELQRPWLLLVAITALPVFFWSRRTAGRVLFSSFRLLPTATSWRARLAWLPDALVALATVAFAAALAGPRTPDSQSRIKREGIAIMMVVDTSGSMRALDLSEGDNERTRLEAVKDVFRDFVLGGDGLPGRSDDAVGVVSFARYADTRAPLTLDHDNLANVARSLEIVTDRSEDGTAIGDGLALAVERLRRSDARSRVAILLTDGVNNAGDEDPLAAAELARAKGVKVYTVGAGTNGMAPVRATNPFTGREELRPVPVEIDEQTLREIADKTSGVYFRATDANALRDVYARIDELERTELEEDRYREYNELFSWAVAVGLALAALGWLLAGTVFRRLP